MKKKKGKDNYSYKRLILVSTMMFCIIVAMVTYWMYAYKYKHGYTYNERLVSVKTSDYVSIDGDIVVLKNIDNNIIIDFAEMQNNIIRNNKIIDNKIDFGIYKNILSIKIKYGIEGNKSNYEEIITLNVDLKNNRKLSNEEMLDMVDSSYNDIATDVFNKYIRIPSDKNIKVIDAINEKEMTTEEFNDNSEKYIIRIREKLPDIIKFYIDDDVVYYIVEINEINKICYYTDINVNNINEKIGKI